MKKEHVIDFLNNGKSFGIQLNPSDPSYMGWIIVAKYMIKQKVFEIYTNDPDSPVYQKEKRKMEKPYWVRVAEMRRDVYGGDSDPLDEHYNRNDFYTFYNIIEVEEFLQKLGYGLADLKWLAEIEYF